MHTLDLLPCAIDRLAVSAISDESQERKEQATLVLQELLKHGSPKELSLSLENQLGVATDEITQCFYLDEDEGGTESHEEDAVKNVNEGETAQKSLKDVHNRLLLVLETHSQGKPLRRSGRHRLSRIMISFESPKIQEGHSGDHHGTKLYGTSGLAAGGTAAGLASGRVAVCQRDEKVALRVGRMVPIRVSVGRGSPSIDRGTR